MADAPLTSTKPYMIRAWHEWCTDNGLTPYVLVKVDHTVSVPREFVQNGEIVLNVGLEATGALNLGNEEISFKARFSGRVRDIVVPMGRVQAIYARENGQGMGFEVEEGMPEEDGAGPVVPQQSDKGTGLAGQKPSAAREALSVVSTKSEASSGTDPAADGAAPKSGSTLRIVK